MKRTNKNTKTANKKAKNTISKEKSKKQESKNIRKIKFDIPSIGIALLFLIVGSISLGQFFGTDEFNWFYAWVSQYWNAVASFNFSEIPSTTYPGAFHSFITGFVNLFLDQKEYLTYDKIETYLFWWRFPILFFNAVSLLIIFRLSLNFFTKIQAYFFIFILAFSPVILGMSRIVNSDSTLWNTAIIAMFGYILYIRKAKRKYIILSGIFMGMALASKYNAVTIFIFHLLTLPLEYIFGKSDNKKIKNQFISLLIIWVIALLSFTFFFPKAISNIGSYNSRIFRYFIKNPLFIALFVFLVIDIFFLNMKMLDFFKNKIQIRKYLQKIIPLTFVLLIIISVLMKFLGLEPESWIKSSAQWKMPFSKSLVENLFGFYYSMQIPILIGIGLLAFFSVQKKHEDKDFSLSIYMIIFILAFIFGASLQGVKTGHRYIIMLYPMAILVAIQSFSVFKKQQLVMLSLIAVLSLVDVALLYPKSYIFYRNTNYISGQHKINWSIGGYDLAQEFNKKKNAKNIKVLADRNSFKLFFKGKTDGTNANKITLSLMKKYDYLCLSSAGYSQVLRTPPLEKYYKMPKDSFAYFVGSKKTGWMGLIKINKKEQELKIANAFDPEYYMDLSKNWAISFWIKPFTENAGNVIYIGKDFKTGFDFEVKNNKFVCKIDDNKIIESGSLVRNKLNSIILMSYSSGNVQKLKIIYNGKEIISTEINKKAIEKFFIATNFKGENNDIRIFDKILSEAEINAIFNGGKMTLEQNLRANGKVFLPKQHFTHKK